MKKPCRVLVVDDSAVIRKLLEKGLSRDQTLEVVGTAPDPYEARDMIVNRQPDVVTLDLKMPRMDGLTFLKKIMEHYPLPVIVLSSLAGQGSSMAMKALDCGAVEVVAKPNQAQKQAYEETIRELRQKIKAASRVNLSASPGASPDPPQNGTLSPISDEDAAGKLIAIGASTGGVQALKEVIPRLPDSSPPIVIAQHMPSGFTTSFSESLDEISALSVREARNGDRLQRGRVLLAPGNRHLMIKRREDELFARVKNGPRVCRQRPSADVLFESVAREAPDRAVGVIMTGMGKDGAEGLMKLREAGGRTIGQDEETSTVYGMPKMAREIGAVEMEVPLGGIPSAILRKVKQLSP